MPGDERRGAFFEDLLMPALERALAFAEMNQISVLVAQHLDFDMPRILDELLDVDFSVAEGALGFARSFAQCGSKLGRRIDPAHAFATPARGGFEHHGKPDVLRDLPCALHVR